MGCANTAPSEDKAVIPIDYESVLWHILIMKVLSANPDPHFLYLETDKGQIAIWGRDYLLDAGLSSVRGTNGNPPTFMREFTIAEDKKNNIPSRKYRGTTDPVLVCLSRRYHTFHNLEKPAEFPIPTLEEAKKELYSGKDIFGGEWSSPTLPEKSFEDSIVS